MINKRSLLANPPIVAVKGAGDLGSGAAWRLHRCGFRVVCTDIAMPTVIRRSVAFASAVFDGAIEVEGVRAERVDDVSMAVLEAVWLRGCVPVLVDPRAAVIGLARPSAVVDCVLAKRNTGTRLDDAPVVVGCGPGFTAGVDCHAVVETQRGHDLGRVLWHGSAEPNTGIPGDIGGAGASRVVRAPAAGIFQARAAIGQHVRVGDALAEVRPAGDGAPAVIVATLTGMLRGILHDGLPVTAGTKVADIDPRGELRYCATISDKALAIGGGVVEAVMTGLARL